MERESLKVRMERYEFGQTRALLGPTGTVIVRLDGRAFHTFTRKLTKPFHDGLHRSLAMAAEALCREVDGAQLAYTQSDEVSLLLHYPSGQTPWFGGRVQKVVSVAASLLSAHFNRNFEFYVEDWPLATFDARVFCLPDLNEAQNYLLWRQRDAARNAVSALAQTEWTHAQLHGRTTEQLREALTTLGRPLESLPPAFQRGSLTRAYYVTEDVEYTDPRTRQLVVARDVRRRRWVTEAAPEFAFSSTSFLGLNPEVYPVNLSGE